MHLVSFVIINYNSSSYTLDCIKSLYKNLKNTDFEVVVVDNKSKIEDFNKLEQYIAKQTHNNLRLVKSKFNLGFSGGNMLGSQFTTGEYIVFLNNDTVLLPEGRFNDMISFMDQNPDVGIIGPQELTSKSEKVPYCYSKLVEPFDVFTLGTGLLPEEYYKKKNPNLNMKAPFEVGEVCGAFILIRNAVFEKIGGFDTNLFLYYEETDICFRTKKLGYKVMHYPQYSYIHHGGKSSKKESSQKELTVSLFYILQKHYPYWQFRVSRFLMILRYGLKSITRKDFRKNLLIALKGGNSLIYSVRFNRKN